MVCISYPRPNFSCQNDVTPNFRLGKFIQLAPPNHKHALDAIWGRLASAICSEQFDAAHEAMTQLRENIDQTGKKFFANRIETDSEEPNRKKIAIRTFGSCFFLFKSIHSVGITFSYKRSDTCFFAWTLHISYSL